MKSYIKPNIAFQNLTLSAGIVNACVYKSQQDAGVCPAEVPGIPGLTVFQEDSQCETYSPELGGMICYHVPTADANVFES